jgi:hypothetical protein
VATAAAGNGLNFCPKKSPPGRDVGGVFGLAWNDGSMATGPILAASPPGRDVGDVIGLARNAGGHCRGCRLPELLAAQSRPQAARLAA